MVLAREVAGASSVILYPWDRQLQNMNGQVVQIGLTKEKKFSNKPRNEDGSMTSIVLRKK